MPPSPVREVVAGRLLRTGRFLQRPGAASRSRETGCWSFMPATARCACRWSTAWSPRDRSAARHRPTWLNGDPRAKLADWMTAPDNPWFARLACNRLWKHFLGRGLVEPEDDLRSTNPATNEPLLDFLTEQLVASGFDLKADDAADPERRECISSRACPTPRTTTTSRTSRTTTCGACRRKSLLDAISDVTGVREEFPGRPPGTRAIELWDNRMPSYFLEIFGRPERNSPCECGRSSEPTMAQALHLMNAPEIEAKIAQPRGRVAQVDRGRARAEDRIVDELCLAALGRPAGEKERNVAAQIVRGRSPASRGRGFSVDVAQFAMNSCSCNDRARSLTAMPRATRPSRRVRRGFANRLSPDGSTAAGFCGSGRWPA